MENRRVALVSGGNRGIGLEIVHQLAERGNTVILGSRDEEQGQAAAEGLSGDVVVRQLDVTDEKSVDWLAASVEEEFGRLDILVNNAGVTSDRSFAKMDQAAWRKVMTTNLDGVFNCTKAFIDGMITRGWGRVVNVTSVIGQMGNFGQANYASSKAGVAAFTKSLAKEVAAKGITVNAIAPGFIETEMITTIPDKIRAKLLEQIPMRRFGRAEEVARACVYLCSADGDYITGTELSINGGLYM